MIVFLILDLAKITDEEANIIMHPKLEDLFEDINEHVIPKVCKSGPVDVEVTGNAYSCIYLMKESLCQLFSSLREMFLMICQYSF